MSPNGLITYTGSGSAGKAANLTDSTSVQPVPRHG